MIRSSVETGRINWRTQEHVLKFFSSLSEGKSYYHFNASSSSGQCRRPDELICLVSSLRGSLFGNKQKLIKFESFSLPKHLNLDSEWSTQSWMPFTVCHSNQERPARNHIEVQCKLCKTFGLQSLGGHRSRIRNPNSRFGWLTSSELRNSKTSV